MATASKQQGARPRDKALYSLTAGATAGAIEAFVTYPTEFVKTRSQFVAKGVAREGPIAIIKNTLRDKGVLGLYSGVGALVVGNAAKAGVRFVTYDYFKSLLADKEGKVSAPRSLVAGLGAGMAEAVIAVTPSETIKTKLIDDANSAKPRFKGLVHGTRTIVAEEGIRGIYRGLFPVMARQGANSAVRFTSYSTLKQFVQGNTRPGQDLPTSLTFLIGGLAGLITVYTTMPLDVVKTRMQTLEARQKYRNALHCAYTIYTEEGILRFWAGTTPRLARLVLSGGIVFSSYEAIMRVFRKLDK